MLQFDPNIPGLIEGEITTVQVIDPALEFPPFERGNHVLDPNKPFQVHVEWKIEGPLRPLWLAALGGNWNVQLFAESVGGGPEILLASDNSVAANPYPTPPGPGYYSVDLNVGTHALPEGDPGSNVSGIYKLVVSVFLNSELGSPGFDMAGFNEGPIIQIEDPH
jgi:hypothetical protein